MTEGPSTSNNRDEPSEDYINISVSPSSPTEPTAPGDKTGERAGSRERLTEEKPPSPLTSRKSFLLSSTGLFHRKKSGKDGKSPRESPEMSSKVEHVSSRGDNVSSNVTQDDGGGQGKGKITEGLQQKKRSKSDVGLITVNNGKDKDSVSYA